MPRPHEDSARSRRRVGGWRSRREASVVVRSRGSAAMARRRRSSHSGPSYHQWPNSSVGGPGCGAVGFVGRLLLPRHVQPRHAVRAVGAERALGVEVAVPRVARVALRRGPDAVGHGEVTGVGHDVGVADEDAVAQDLVSAVVGDVGQRRSQRRGPARVHAQRRAGRVADPAAGAVAELRRPQADRAGTGPALVRREARGELGVEQGGVVEQRQVGMGGGTAEQLDHPAVGEVGPDREQAAGCLDLLVERQEVLVVAPVVVREVADRLVQPPVPALLLGTPHLPAQPRAEVTGEPRVADLRRDHRRHAEREDVGVTLVRQPAQDPRHRQPGVAPGLEQPLLTDGPDAVVGQPGQVGVQDEGDLAGHPWVAAAHGTRQTATRSSEASRSSSRTSKSSLVTACTRPR